MTLPTHVHESCWTDGYLMAHSEGYRVEDENGERVGVVDSVLWPDEVFGDAEAVVVRRTGRPGRIVIPLDEISEIDPWNERIVVSAEIVGRLRPVSRRPLVPTIG